MPRRPRPAHRRPEGSSSKILNKHPVNGAKSNGAPSSQLRKVDNADEDDETEEDGQQHVDLSGASGSEEDDGEDDDEEDEEIPDADAPRVAQWVDEDELDGAVDGEDYSDASSESEVEEESHLQDDLASLPLGALRKAQRALAQASALEGSDEEHDDEDVDDEDDSGPEQATSQVDLKGKGKEKEETKGMKAKNPKRSNKHAPMETTSKRPVPRKRLSTEEKKLVPRDPRFLPLVGEFSAQKFQSQYSFLSDMHSGELSTLRDNLKRARKLLTTSPRDLREEREQEVQRLERAVKRAESTVNRDIREKIEQEALKRVAQDERAKRKDGKGSWYLKQSDKKELLLRAKFDALAADGGGRAVKKAIERKQKKIGQKEKKRRPFASAPPLSRSGDQGNASFGERRAAKRQNTGNDDPGSGKRRKFA